MRTYVRTRLKRPGRNADAKRMSTWVRTRRALEADAAADRLLAVYDGAWAFADRLAAAGDRASAAAAGALGDAALADLPPVRVHYAALVLGVEHAQAVAWTRDGTFAPVPWTGQLRVALIDVARLARARRAAPTLRAAA